MKNQFFGDNRDLFKYDLILSVVKGFDQVGQFTFIPMLTEDSGDHGNQIDRRLARAGYNNIKLINYLDKCIKNNKRNIIEIKRYYNNEGMRSFIYRENEYFQHSSRVKYFSNIPMTYLRNSLILVDPDNGLEIKRSDEKHIFYAEINDLYGRMNGNSILMIFQFFPRQKREEYIRRRVNELKDRNYDMPRYISDNVIIFFFLAKNDGIRNNLFGLFKDYASQYERLYFG